MSPNEEKYKALGREGHTGPLPNRELAWLQAGGATSSVLAQAWREWLDTQGFSTGIFNKDWYDYLGSNGFTGTLNEREVAFWTALGQP